MKRFATLLCTLAFIGACGESEPNRPSGPVPLVAHDSWVVSSADTDPFTGTRADYKPCDQTAVAREEVGGLDSVEVKTGVCNYITLEQPLASTLRRGDEILIRVWHFFLDELPDAEAYVALQAGDNLLWDRKVPLPTDSGILSGTFILEADVAAEETVYFHIRNHGRNSWHLLEVTRL